MQWLIFKLAHWLYGDDAVSESNSEELHKNLRIEDDQIEIDLNSLNVNKLD